MVAAYAVAFTLVPTRTSTPQAEMLCRLSGVIASLRATGFKEDVVCITHSGGASASASGRALVRELGELCTHVLDVPTLPTLDAGPYNATTPEVIEYYRARQRVPPPTDARVQRRDDGAATALKLYAWTLSYALILHADIDVLFLESPSATLVRAEAAGTVFHAAASEQVSVCVCELARHYTRAAHAHAHAHARGLPTCHHHEARTVVQHRADTTQEAPWHATCPLVTRGEPHTVHTSRAPQRALT
jgi:hypothetical protein